VGLFTAVVVSSGVVVMKEAGRVSSVPSPGSFPPYTATTAVGLIIMVR